MLLFYHPKTKKKEADCRILDPESGQTYTLQITEVMLHGRLFQKNLHGGELGHESHI